MTTQEHAPQALTLDPQALDACRPALLRLCYRMLGSMSDAEDAVQETLLRGWRAAQRYEGRASLRTWLCRIATRVCLDQYAKRSRTLPPLLAEAGTIDDPMDPRDHAVWIEPIAQGWASAPSADPEDALLSRESVSLAWVSAMQQLTASQRACFVLMEIVGLSAEEAAHTLELTVPSVNSALQRARRALEAARASDALADPTLDANREAVARFTDAFARYDLDALATLLREDATMCMPPLALWLRGADAIVAWMGGRGAGCRGSRVFTTHANGKPALAQYRPNPTGGHTAWAIVCPLAHEGVVDELHFFLDTQALFPRFGLPLTLPEGAPDPTL